MYDCLNYDITVKPSLFTQAYFELEFENIQRSFGAFPLTKRDACKRKILSDSWDNDAVYTSTEVDMEQIAIQYESHLQDKATGLKRKLYVHARGRSKSENPYKPKSLAVLM